VGPRVSLTPRPKQLRPAAVTEVNYSSHYRLKCPGPRPEDHRPCHRPPRVGGESIRVHRRIATEIRSYVDIGQEGPDLFPGTGLGHSSNSRFTGCGLHQCRGLITFDIAVMWCSQMDRHEKEGAEPDEGPSGPEETPSQGRAQDDGMHQAPLCLESLSQFPMHIKLPLPPGLTSCLMTACKSFRRAV
jgi:hypothetical protein